MDALQKLRLSARPVVFETGNTEAPYMTAGTAMLVAFRRNLYVVTPKHVVRDHPIERLIVFPGDKSRNPLRLSESSEATDSPQFPDLSDVMFFRVSLASVPREDRSSSHLIDLTNPESSSWFGRRHTSKFFLFGYPQDQNWVDYDEQAIKTSQYFLTANYLGYSSATPCHELEIEDSLPLLSLSGFSGSPVFSIQAEIAASSKTYFCGMAVRGGLRARRLHFIPAAAIVAVLAKVEDAQPSVGADPRKRASPALLGRLN